MPVTYFQENSRGRFLKVSETFTRGYSRFQVFIPADGMEEFNNQVRQPEFDSATGYIRLT